jgi:hypothetical protein
MSLADLQEAVCLRSDFQSSGAFPQLPRKLRLLITRLLEKERIRRPMNAGQVGSILRDKELLQ